MTIRQAAKETGLSSPNIRYYEKEGLLKPGRNAGNGYREYTEEDVERLKRIRCLRTLGIPVQQLRGVFAGKMPLAHALEERRRQLVREQREIVLLGELCDSLLEQNVQAENLDADLLSLKLEFSQRKEELLMNRERNKRLEKTEETCDLINKCGIVWVCTWQLTKLFPQFDMVWRNPWIVLPPVIAIFANLIVLCVVRQIKR